MSITSAPSASICNAWSIACAASKEIPPSEKESGVTFSTPMMSVRSPNCRGARPGRGSVNLWRAETVIGLQSTVDRGPWTVDRGLLLCQRLGNRRNERRTFLIACAITRRIVGWCAWRCNRWYVFESLAACELTHLVGVEHLARQECVGNVEQRLLVR